VSQVLADCIFVNYNHATKWLLMPKALNINYNFDCDRSVCMTLLSITHTHTQLFYGPLGLFLSGTNQVSWYQKGKTRKVKPIWIY